MITLATLSQATAQEVFDQVAVHLLTQDKQSKSNKGCVYRNSKGLRCAAGCLISDDEYLAEMETHDWEFLIDEHLVPEFHHELIKSLQNIHDAYDPIDWLETLVETAEEYLLNTEALTPWLNGNSSKPDNVPSAPGSQPPTPTPSPMGTT